MLSSQLINLIAQIFLARLLLSEDFGLIGMTTIFIAISQSLIDSGFSSALIRKKDISESDYSTVFMFNLVVSISIYFALFASSRIISGFFNEPRLIPIIRVLSTVFIINSFGIVQSTMLIREIDLKPQTKITIISSAISGVIAILVALVGFGKWALVIRTIVGQVIQSVMLVMFDQIKNMSLIFLATILAATVFYYLMYFLHISDILLLLVQLITGLSTYVIACLLFKIDELHDMRDIYRVLVKP